ncbi:MAG TPA: FHA domain-containing protein [Blastocatellia bacterium]|jgi:hypothetical protein
MADKNDSVLDKAESLARRILERLGSKVDAKSAAEQTLSPREVGELTSRIERVIEANLREDKNGVKRVAANRYKVLFTYEETSRLNSQYIELLAKELKAAVFEFINNRRYEVLGPVEVETGSDLFAKTTVIRPAFEGESNAPNPMEPPSNATSRPGPSAARPAGVRTMSLQSADGRSFRVELKPDSAPAYIGRASTNAVRIDDSSISRLHASIAQRSNGEIVIADLGSSNGTYVNERMLAANEARALNPGDVIGVGDFKLTVSVVE